MNRIEVLHEQLIANSENARKQFVGIDSLASSIKAYGLFHNLVVKESRDRPGSYVIVAGERRYRAIGLLIDSNDWPREKRLPVVVIGGEGTWENLAENVSRNDLWPWELGSRLREMLEGGYNQTEICEQTGLRAGKVSQLVRIGTLPPETVMLLIKSGVHWPITELVKISALRIPREDTPDLKSQKEYIERALGQRKGRKRRKKEPKDKKQQEKVFDRYVRLRDNVPVSSAYRPIVESVLDYLSGRTRKLMLPK